jgi:ABC-2 type transport system ATP-binding protein
MDEAERCHDIGYILYGELIARGTAQEIIEKSGLVTFNGEGQDIGKVAGELEGKDGVLSASAFGASVHVSGVDRAALEKAIAPYRREPFNWTEVSPSLEDVFIQLMGKTSDDRYAA